MPRRNHAPNTRTPAPREPRAIHECPSASPQIPAYPFPTATFGTRPQPKGATMRHRKIGTSDLQVAPLVLGGNVFGWTADERTSFSILDAFVDHGLNFIDTADVYSAWVDGHHGGESEAIIGKWFKESGKRDKI